MDKKDIKDFSKYIKLLGEFMSNNGVNVKPFPKIKLDNSEQDGLFIKTGYYAPAEKKVVVFINGRALKDCCKTVCHEFVHHSQNLRGENLSFSGEDKVKDNSDLEKLEAEAYLKGCILFRKWTEYLQDKPEMLNEGAWGYKPENSDSYWDYTHDVFVPAIKTVTKGIKDSLGVRTSGGYAWMGLANDILKEKDTLKELKSELKDMIKVFNEKYEEYMSEDNMDGWDDVEKFKKELKSLKKDFDKNSKEFIKESRNRVIKNDEGNIVPDKCPECGSDVKLYIKGEPVYLCSNEKCNKYFGTAPCNIHEGKEKGMPLLSELNASSVDLSSFKIKHDLNPKFWADEHLDKRIRMKLLDLADDFIKELNVDWADYKDIIMTGSLANFNWDKKYSDIDLHILYDFKDIDENKDFVKAYFDAKKTLWNEKHEGLKIFGFPVEVYVQDVNEKHNSSGIYSLDKDKWIDEPEYDKMASHKIDYNKVKKSVAKYATEIDKLFDEFNASKKDIHKSEELYKKSDELFKKIKNERTSGFEKDKSELNTGNIIFKALRRMNYIGKIVDLKEKTYNIINSIR